MFHSPAPPPVVAGRAPVPDVVTGGVDKPIVSFHWEGEQPLPEEGVAMKVRFPDGRPVIWWPASAEGAGSEPARSVMVRCGPPDALISEIAVCSGGL